MDDPSEGKPPTFWQMLHSILAAALGVQSGKNRARDFNHGKASHFIALGALFTLIFIFVLIGLVQLAVHLTAR
ncbi:hypothetical protein CCOS865_02320 [Pseudomonas reidholzensis]|uniref:DUF2970 domain-containing protein n=1 Tax=Pseudomonas reidholzensis TaxID=1785162 RepID=A0A383RTS2_9PSED|nr:DUF2970 domain-containing protein [Pseudomonas reidholzensis]SYX90054.1 hypothetical protein CCOS865_02320 [Pseudomonas reidholzensis]